MKLGGTDLQTVWYLALQQPELRHGLLSVITLNTQNKHNSEIFKALFNKN